MRANDSVEVDLSYIDTSKGVLFLPVRTLHYGLYRAVVSYNVSMTSKRKRILLCAKKSVFMSKRQV